MLNLKRIATNYEASARSYAELVPFMALISPGIVINKDGSVSDVVIMRDIGGGCGKEAVRVVKSMPKWIPGEANGHAVKVRYTLPVRFKLE